MSNKVHSLVFGTKNLKRAKNMTRRLKLPIVGAEIVCFLFSIRYPTYWSISVAAKQFKF